MYVKLFSSIYQGTLRGNSHGLLVFTNLLAHADQEGFVDIHPRAISEEVGLPVADVRSALLMLEETDPESRTLELDGRRIVRMDEHRDWGWQIVNYIKYKKIRNEEDRREQNREAQKRFRDKNKLSQPSSADRNQSKPRKPQSAHTDTDTDTDKKTSAPLPDWLPKEAWDGFMEARRKAKKPVTDRAKTILIGKLEGFKDAGYDIAPILDASTEAGWSSVYEPKGNAAPKGYVSDGRPFL